MKFTTKHWLCSIALCASLICLAATGAGIRSATIAATTTNSTTQLRMDARTVAFFNKGPNVAWVNLSRTAVAAAAVGTNIPVFPNTWFQWRATQGESVSQVGTITATGTATVMVFSALAPDGLTFLYNNESCNVPDVGTDITIDNTVGGVEVVAADIDTCEALIYNGGSENVRCAFKNETPTSTLGMLLKPEASWTLRPQDGVQLGVNCIREGAVNSTVSVHVGVRE